MKEGKFIIILTFFFSIILQNEGNAQLEILSGLKRGSYYRFANDIKQITSVPVEVKTSNGSVDNFNQIVSTKKPMITFLQYDVLIYKKYKDRENNTHFTENIRVLAPLAKEEIHLIVRKNSKIKTLVDLKNKRVAIGAENQGTYVTASLIKAIINLHWIDVPIEFEKAFNALLDGKVDAIFFVGYAPATKIYRFPLHTNIKLVPIKHKKLQSVYTSVTIPPGTYPWADYEVPTYAVKSVLVTNVNVETDQSKQEVTKVLSDMNSNINTLRQKGHVKWKEVDYKFSNIKFNLYDGVDTLFNNNIEIEKIKMIGDSIQTND